MKRLIEFNLDDDSTIIVEVNEFHSHGGTIRASKSGEIIEKAEQTFGQAIERIKPVADCIIKNLRDISRQPNEIGVEFGFKLNAKAGIVIASMDTEANFKVTLSWKRSS